MTQNDTGSLFLCTPICQDDVIATTGADELARGTVMARVTASGKLGLYAPGGSGGLSVPVGILSHAVSASGAGDHACRLAVKSECNKRFLVLDADGDDSNITAAVKDALRDSADCIVHELTQLSQQES